MRFAPALLALMLAAQLLLVWRIHRVQARQKAHQNELANALHDKRFWRIVIARPEHLQTLWKLDHIQARGVLIDEGAALRIQGRWHATAESFDTLVPKLASSVGAFAGPSNKGGNRHWAMLKTSQGELMFAADTGVTRGASGEALADIFRSVLPGQWLATADTGDFALEKGPRAVLAMGVFFALAILALLDTWVFAEFELIDAQLVALWLTPWFVALVAAGLLAIGLPVHRGLRAGKVPAQEATVLSVMVAAAFAAAAVPVLKRLDQQLAVAPTQDHRYRVADTAVRLEPIDKRLGLPPLRFLKAREYWAQFPPGSEVTIPLLRGPLGLWQLDHTRFDPPVLAFYEKLEVSPAR